MAEIVGKTFDGFRILEELGSGGEGIIYRAVCEVPRFGLEPGTTVALKMMSVSDNDGHRWRRLNARTQELVRLRHPNVVRYHGCFHVPQIGNDLQFVVQEFLHGETLKHRLAHDHYKLGLEVEAALKILSNVLDGLIYTTANGIVHRDIKPSNIFICRDGAVKLIDFEIAKRETKNEDTPTDTGRFLGSYDYLAPDFLLDSPDAQFSGDVRSDVFSLGVVMHEVLTKKYPYLKPDGGTAFAFANRYVQGDDSSSSPIQIHDRVKFLIGEYGKKVLQNALACSRKDRYADFSQFNEDFKKIRPYVLHARYEMLQLIGEGGYGEVFKARDQSNGKYVAIKRLFKAQNEKKFLKEARAMQELDDPNFVRFVDFFESAEVGNQDVFLVMEFLDGMPGSSLHDAIRRMKHDGRCLPMIEVLAAFERFARGLYKMHQRGISHRDIKPSNLYYPEGHPERAAIMDLGIIHDAKGSTTHGAVAGTLEYMSPEVVLLKSRGEGPGDIYALGLCLYEALTGGKAYPPLPKKNPLVARVEREKKKVQPTFHIPEKMECATELLRLLMGMTQLVPKKRFSADAVVERIKEITKKVQIRLRKMAPPVKIDQETLTSGSKTIVFDISTGETQKDESIPPPDLDQSTPVDPVPYTNPYGAMNDQPWWRRKAVIWTIGGVAAVGLLLVVVVGWPIVKMRTAKSELDGVVRAYQKLGDYDGTAILEEESRWMAQFGPMSETLWCLSPKDYSECTNLLEVAKSELLSRSSPGPAGGENGYAEFFPDKEKGIICLFNGMRFESQTNVVTVTGNYNCAYQNLAKTNGIFKFERKSVWFTVKGNSHTHVPAPSEWDMTTDYKMWLETNSVPLKIEQDSVPTNTLPKPKPVQVLLPDSVKRAEAIGKCRKLMETEPVDTRQERLENAEDVLQRAVDDQLLTDDEFSKLKADVGERKRWIVGKVANNSQRTIEVDGQKIMSGSSKLFTFTNGLPQLWEARSEGAEPIPLKRNFDGREIEVKDDDVKQLPVLPRSVEVKIPELPEGVYCMIDGEDVGGGIRRNVGQSIEYKYVRNGYDYTGPTRYTVKDVDRQSLPPPKEKEWSRKPVKMFMPHLLNDISCSIDGERVSSGGEVSRVPGSQMVCVYHREGYHDVTITNDVPNANFTEIPGPKPDDWRLLPVSVRLSPLPQGVTCLYKGESVRDPIECVPDQEILLTFRRSGFADLEVRYRVTRDSHQTISAPGPKSWDPKSIQVSLPELPPGATCWINGQKVSESLVRKPKDRLLCVYKRDGYKDVSRDYVVTDVKGQVLPRPSESEWVRESVLVSVPDLPSDVTCLVDGRPVRGALSRQPHEKVICTYRRSGYKEITITHEVTDAAKQMLPRPKPSEWEFEPVQVGVPYLPAGITCWIDGREVPGGGSVTNLPGSTITCTYQRKGYNDVQKEYQVTLAVYQDLPPPTREDWMLLPVDIKIPELPGGVTCWIDGKEVTGSISRKPGDLIEVVYRRRGYVDVKQSVPVGMDDNQVLTCPADEVWRLQAVKVLVPELQDGVTCMVNGQRAFGTLLKRPHEKVICTYRRSGYKEITITHEVTDAAEQTLPRPEPSEWEYEPVQVGVPYLPADITCWIDGREVPGGGSVTNLPGTTITCTYQRKGYNDVQKEYQVTLAAYQDMPPPTREDWKLLPVDVKIPELPSGVTCWIDDKEVTGPVSRRPGDRIVVIYRRAGYEEIKQRKEVTFEPEQRLQAPALSEWRPIEVRVKIPELPKGVTLWIDGHRQTEAIVAKPGVRLRCEYKKEGFKDVVRNYLVSSDVDQILTGPGDEWKELPVSVVVPKLEGGVEIWIDNQKVTSGTQLSLQPGLHTCKYLRQDYEPQELPFSVNYDNAEWPLPKKWKEVGILRFISEAEEALENGNPQKAQNLLRQIAADAQGSSGAALSPQNKERAKSILKQAENVESAQFRYGDGEDGSDWVGALEYLAKAVAAGYRVSNSDWEMVEDAYPKAISPSRIRKKEWEEWYKQPIKGPRPAGSYEKAKEDLEKIAQWYEQCERARR